VHSTGSGPSHSERSRRLSCVRRRLRFVLASVLLPAGLPAAEQWRRHDWRRAQQKRAAELVVAHLGRGLHACRSADAKSCSAHGRGASAYPDLRDIFLCHAWDDRRGAAKELHDLLESNGVSVWFSEKDVMLGAPLLRAIDKGLAKSRAGIVLVTPALLTRVASEGIADKELSELLARDQLIPVVHETTWEALREVSPLLGSRSGLSTAADSMADVAAKIAELVDVQTC
jgi:TIR domain